MTMQADPFAAVRLKSKQQAQPVKEESKQRNQEIDQSDPFSAVRVKKIQSPSGPSNIYETGRFAARIGSRIAETLGGIPGDVQSLVHSGLFYGLEKLVGQKASPEAREKAKQNRFPTSGELKEKSQELTKGFTSPQNEAEKIGDELAETVASLIGPLKFRKAIGVAVGSQAAKEGIKLLGLGEGSQEAGKLGTMFLLTTLNPGGAMKYASSQYQKANELSKGASIKAISLENGVKNLLEDLRKGVKTPSKNAVIRPAEDILEKIKDGKIAVHDLTAAKRDLNTLMKDPELLKREKKLLKVLGKDIDHAIKPFEAINPEFKKAYRPANEIYGAVAQGTKASDFIRKTLGNKSFFGVLIGELAVGHPEFILPTISSAAVAMGGAKTVDFFTRLAKSKELRKYYGKSMQAAIKEDAASLRIYAEKIEREMEKD